MDEKDKLISSLKAEGKSLRKIAKEVGISHVAVKYRLDRLNSEEAEEEQPVQAVDYDDTRPYTHF